MSSRNSKRTKRKPIQGRSVAPSTHRQDAASSAQGSMLLALPVELFERIEVELLKGSRLITKADVMCNMPLVYKDKFNHRTEVLLPLAQTCRALRRVYLARVYEQMEVWTVRERHNLNVGYKPLAKRLEGMTTLLTRENELAKFVRVLTVSLSRYSTGPVLHTFADSLAQMANLHTLQVCYIQPRMTSALETVFQGRRFPQIRTVILPTDARHILRACPNVSEVMCNSSGREDKYGSLLKAIKEECEHVEALEGFDYFVPEQGSSLSDFVPRLKRLVLLARYDLENFAKVPQLSELILNIPVHYREPPLYRVAFGPRQCEAYIDQEEDHSRQWWIDRGVALLRKSDVKTPRTLTVVWLMLDRENSTVWNHWATKVFYTVKITI